MRKLKCGRNVLSVSEQGNVRCQTMEGCPKKNNKLIFGSDCFKFKRGA